MCSYACLSPEFKQSNKQLSTALSALYFRIFTETAGKLLWSSPHCRHNRSSLSHCVEHLNKNVWTHSILNILRL